MADNYLMLDGKKYELSPELANALRSCVEPEPEKKSPFARAGVLDDYWTINSRGVVDSVFEDNSNYDSALFAVANYCTDKALMEQRAMHEILNRLLWRYSEEHGGDNPWDRHHNHCYLFYDEANKDFGVFGATSLHFYGVVYFKDKATAEDAIEEIVKPFLDAHPDFVW